MSVDGVPLIPGFFGFGTFGAADHVIDGLLAERPDLGGRIVATEPPPTGALATRVHHLEAAVRAALTHGIGAAHAPIDRLHLVGHSTGGVDARLLTNRRHGLDPSLLERIGAVVTVAAPLHGTPIATRLAGAFTLTLAGVSLLEIVAEANALVPPVDLAARSLLVGLVDDRFLNAALTRLLLELDPATAAEVARFLGAILRDHDLLHDLAPTTMRRRNADLAGGDHGGLRHVVTVAPPPPLVALEAHAADAAFRALYAIVYTATADATFTPPAFPRGPWLHGSDPTLSAGAPAANDGIVPATSQTVGGTAHAVVEADHLDVIGHFASRRFPGTTVLKSGAAFDDVDFQELWWTVGGMLR